MRALFHKIAAGLIAYGPWGVFVLAIIDSVGIPLPAAIDALLIGVAASSAHSPGTAYFTAFLAVLGSVGGNIVLFQAASHGRKLMTKGEPPPGKRRRLGHWFRRYGLLTVFICAVTPVLPLPLKVFVISAAAFHASFGRFLAVIVLARVIRYFGEAYLGLQLGQDAQGFLVRNGWTLAGSAVAMSLALYLLMRLADRRRESML